ncbi:MAG: hypothetical protein ACK4K0_11210 [Flavobacteriales bacterium]
MGSTSQSCYFDFQVMLNPNTEKVTVQLIDATTQQIVSTQQYTINSNNCCNFYWTSNNLSNHFWSSAFSSCKNYQVKITTSNYCYPNNIAQQIMSWNQPTNYGLQLPLPNVITLLTEMELMIGLK